jgi:hypothetical protein
MGRSAHAELLGGRMKLSIFLVCVLGCNCQNTVPPVVHTWPPVVNPPSECAAVCKNLRNTLHCTGSEATTNGHSCEERCAVLAPSIGWNMDCRAKATSCDAVAKCEQ